MKNPEIFILALCMLTRVSIQESFSKNTFQNTEIQTNSILVSDEIIFYSNGSTFSPVIVLQAAAEVIWTWNDNTTSNSLSPNKDYGSAQLRPNRLKVTPWSAVRRINIGYDAGDGGTNSIEFVNDQHVSLIENLSLVAPYIKEWCSSYNDLTSLDFSNFINIETIECFLCRSITSVNLINTPKLRRACFEDNNLLSLDLSDCISLEDLRGAVNNYSTLIFPNQSNNVWHICLRDNPQITNQHLVNSLALFPKVAELWIWNTNQQGDLIIPQTNPTRSVSISAYNNHFTSIDLRGSFLNIGTGGSVDMRYNELTKVDISGCLQIKKLDLSHNLLASEVIDQMLKQVDEYATNNGTIDLRYNQPPTFTGLSYKANLESRGWIVNTDQNIPIETVTVSSAVGSSISTLNGTLQLKANILPANATTKTVNWSVQNITGRANISSSGLITAERNGIVKAIATATDGSGIDGEFMITISNQTIQMAVKVMLEGAVNGNAMALNLHNYIPLSQPYNAAPWNYNGMETVVSVPDNIVDWILVELRQAATASEATSSTIMSKRSALLKTDGSIVDHLTGDVLIFDNLSVDTGKSLFVVIRHRNHLAIMSANSPLMNAGIYEYDFTSGVNQAYGGSNGYKATGMVTADADQDGNIFVSDYNRWAAGFGLSNGYYGFDFDMDGNAFVSDYNRWANNFGFNIDLKLKSAPTRSKYFSNVPE